MRAAWPTIVVCLVLLGCGTSKWSDTKRTATEQLLISDAMDRAVSRLDFRAVAAKKVFLDSSYLEDVTDAPYLISSLRQHMLAGGCIMMDNREEADYVVEVRVGAVGTDRNELVFGVPATRIPDVIPVSGVPTNIPEMPLAKRTEQRAVAKIAVFAYNRRTGRPVWQSGVVPVESTARDIWVLGAGPFQRGTIYEGTKLAGDKLDIPLVDVESDDGETLGEVSVANPAFFSEAPEQLVAETKPKPPAKADKNDEVQEAEKKPAAADKNDKVQVAKKKPAKPAPAVVPATHVEPVSPPTEPLLLPKLEFDAPLIEQKEPAAPTADKPKG